MKMLRAFALIAILTNQFVVGAFANGEVPATVLIVVGADGEAKYAEVFARSAQRWQEACKQAGAQAVTIGHGLAETNSLTKLKQAIDREVKTSSSELWIVFLGHGTYDGREAKFNLRGDDVSAADLAEWLKPLKRPLVLVNTSASSAPFLAKLSAPGRVIITATRSGSERNYAHFGEYFSEAIADPKADLDKDGQTSLLEAFLAASRRLGEFYEGEGRLTTEHALLDDNGDGLGTQADWFRGIRAVKRAKEGAAADGLRAHQIHLVRSKAEREIPPEVRAQRDALELELARLRDAKAAMKEDEYYAQLEVLMVRLAELYEGKPAPRN
ncbi:MAG TPA: hypothetical protein VI454_08880 [Verrucomicrobiae bacterium]|jgi:hypothetical protein